MEKQTTKWILLAPKGIFYFMLLNRSAHIFVRSFWCSVKTFTLNDYFSVWQNPKSELSRIQYFFQYQICWYRIRYHPKNGKVSKQKLYHIMTESNSVKLGFPVVVVICVICVVATLNFGAKLIYYMYILVMYTCSCFSSTLNTHLDLRGCPVLDNPLQLPLPSTPARSHLLYLCL